MHIDFQPSDWIEFKNIQDDGDILKKKDGMVWGDMIVNPSSQQEERAESPH